MIIFDNVGASRTSPERDAIGISSLEPGSNPTGSMRNFAGQLHLVGNKTPPPPYIGHDIMATKEDLRRTHPKHLAQLVEPFFHLLRG